MSLPDKSYRSPRPRPCANSHCCLSRGRDVSLDDNPVGSYDSCVLFASALRANRTLEVLRCARGATRPLRRSLAHCCAPAPRGRVRGRSLRNAGVQRDGALLLLSTLRQNRALRSLRCVCGAAPCGVVPCTRPRA